MTASARQAALLMLTDDDSPILRIAREVTSLAGEHQLEAAVIGGVGVFLHGYPRTTKDVDVWCHDREALVALLKDHGYRWHGEARELVKDDIPVHLLAETDTGYRPQFFEERAGVRVVSLAEMITLKLKTGVHRIERAQDLADVVELIRGRGITESYSSRIAEDVRPEFRRILRELHA